MNPESLDEVLNKRDSLTEIWRLLNPKPEFCDRYTFTQFMREWNRLSYRRQQQFWWFIAEKKRKNQRIYDNPLYNLIYIHPQPTDWNGKEGIQFMMKHKKMVSAFYDGRFGIYQHIVATIFEMTHITPLNY